MKKNPTWAQATALGIVVFVVLTTVGFLWGGAGWLALFALCLLCLFLASRNPRENFLIALAAVFFGIQ
jgi:hypothetical protein